MLLSYTMSGELRDLTSQITINQVEKNKFICEAMNRRAVTGRTLHRKIWENFGHCSVTVNRLDGSTIVARFDAMGWSNCTNPYEKPCS